MKYGIKRNVRCCYFSFVTNIVLFILRYSISLNIQTPRPFYALVSGELIACASSFLELVLECGYIHLIRFYCLQFLGTWEFFYRPSGTFKPRLSLLFEDMARGKCCMRTSSHQLIWLSHDLDFRIGFSLHNTPIKETRVWSMQRLLTDYF